ncbi:hypothetical protein QBC45DRAFT_337392 [Copromyces sp. CBS 386.78]|nr:hypothetical protein QBC45DRAFT_337392 [Copromyces sp. CBS 386.78]
MTKKKKKRKKNPRESNAPAANRTRGPSMATMDFTTKPLALVIDIRFVMLDKPMTGNSYPTLP